MTSTTRTISVITTVIGVLIIAAFVTAAGLPFIGSGFRGGPSTENFHSAPLDGITQVRVNSREADVHLAFGDVTEAELEVSSPVEHSWRWKTSGDRLIATNGKARWCFMWCSDHDEQVTITLPKHLEGRLAGRLDLSSGRLTADGDFEKLKIEVAAGTVTYTGASPVLDVDLSAGAANVTVADVKEADLEVAAGTLTANLSGEAPERIRAELSAGRLDLTVPDVAYQVRTDLAFGNLDNQLRTAPDSPHQINLELAAGRATLRSQH